jgi:hypothetical protein
MNCKRTWRIAGALGLLLVVPATFAQTPAAERPVTRPDGTVVYPFVDEQQTRGNQWWQRNRGAASDEQERRRVETQQSTLERQEMRTREREGALQNPARQIQPSTGR